MVHFVEDEPDSGSSSHAGVAPVIPLFGSGASARRPSDGRPRSDRHSRSDGHPTGGGVRRAGEDRSDGPQPSQAAGRERARRPGLALAGGRDASVDAEVGRDVGLDAEAEAALAEGMLLKKLRTRSLSVAEARAVVAERDLDEGQVLTLLDDCLRRGYLDDAALAEQLVHSATTRKGQGRRAVAQTLAKRGIPRDVAEAAIAEMPDDEAERALEFARSKARSMGSLEFDTALRRLSGQLARRGYGGSVATSAAREALAEVGVGRSSVRFR